jgi:hypothetical protein
LSAELEQNPKALRLAIADAQTAGPAGLRRLQKTTAVCEGLLAGALSGRCPATAGGNKPEDGAAGEHRAGDGTSATEAGDGAGNTPAAEAGDGGEAGGEETERFEALPLPVVRAIVGGLRRTTQMRLLDDDTVALGPLVGEMAKWTLLFKSPAVARLRPRRCANPPFPETLELEPDACGGESRRARVLRSAIETGLCERKFADLNSPRIAEGAGLPFEAVTELYPDPHACYVEALNALGDELLQLVAGPELVSAEWPAAVCHTIDALLTHLAGSPARLMTLAVKALEAGPAGIANVDDLSYELATLLTEGAPGRPSTRIAIEGIAGGLWNILYCEALAGRGHLLPVLSEYISYVVLTPYLGPEAAVEAIVRARTAARPPGRPTQSPAGAPAATASANGHAAGSHTAAGNGTAGHRATATSGAAPAGEHEGEGGDEDYRRLAERRSAKCVNTTPTSTESAITMIKGA